MKQINSMIALFVFSLAQLFIEDEVILAPASADLDAARTGRSHLAQYR